MIKIQNATLQPTFFILHSGALGDFILTWSSLHCLRNAFPEARILAMGHPSYLSLAHRFGLIDEILDVNSRQGMRLLSGENLPEKCTPTHGAILWTKPIPSLNDLLKNSFPLLFIDPFPEASGHLAQLYCEMISQVFPIHVPSSLPSLFPQHEPKARYVFIHPGSGSPAKQFSPLFYIQLQKSLLAWGFEQCAFLMGPAEIERGLPEAFPGQQLIFSETPEALADWLENASLFIGNDSGVSHLAGYMGIPSIVFYITTDPQKWGALGRNVCWIMAKTEEEAFSKFSSALDTLLNAQSLKKLNGYFFS